MDARLDMESYVTVHTPSELYPADWRPESTEEVWISTPTDDWCMAAEAWGDAVSCMAYPLFGEAWRILSNRVRPDPSVAVLRELVDECIRVAEWLPTCADDHFAALNLPELWQHRTQYGLTWHSSVQTILARTSRGWEVRIIGRHETRRMAAERVLGEAQR